MKIKLIVCLALLAGAMNLAARNVVEDAQKAIFRLTTYDATGKVLSETPAFFISEKGIAVASYSAFRNASKAVFTYGKKKANFQATRITGANDVYDVVLFQTNCDKCSFLPVGLPDSSLVLLTDQSRQPATPVKVTDNSKFKNYSYYTFDAVNADSLCSYPVINAQGEVVAVTQKNMLKNATGLCGLDASAFGSLKITSLSFADESLRGINICKALPAEQQEARSYLFLFTQSSKDSLACETAFSDYLTAYPDNSEMLVERANYHARNNRWDLVDPDINAALKNSDKKDEVYYAYSRLILQNTGLDSTNKELTFTNALTQAQKAYEVKPEPLYMLQQGHCLFAEKKYEEAYKAYEQVNATNLASNETFFYAARTLSKYSKDTLKIVSLLDSAVARCPQPLDKKAAPYVWERARFLDGVGYYRKAVQDYNIYEKLYEYKDLDARFYLIREGAELAGRLYQQALNDIDKVIEMESDKGPFYLEKAVIYLSAGERADALTWAQQAEKLLPNDAEVNRILGVCYGENKDNEKACQYLNKAIQLGDKIAERILPNYSSK